MNILILPSTYDCQNVGDVAMLEVAVSELRRVWPGSTLEVLTEDVDALAFACPGVGAVGQEARRPRSRLYGYLRRIHPLLSTWMSSAMEIGEGALEQRLAGVTHRVRMMRLRRLQRQSFQALGEAIERSELVVCSGAGSMNDCFPMRTRMILDILEMSVRLGKPTVMLSQGIGPLRRRDLRARARVYLPRLKMIGVREKLYTVPFLRSIGVADERLVDTGDDAVALAYAQAPMRTGNAIGANLRVASYAEVDEGVISRFCSVLSEAASRHKTNVLPIPIATGGDRSDWRPLEKLLGDAGGAAGNRRLAATPLATIQQAGRCRIVVTGAYHAAVFALSQGVPAICLARSEYFQNKFAGLADEFGLGCHVILLEGDAIERTLPRVIDDLWDTAVAVRQPLLQAAARQTARIHAAYDALRIPGLCTTALGEPGIPA